MIPSRRLNFQWHKRLWRVVPFAMRPEPRGASVLLYHNVDDAPSPYVRRLGVTISTAHFEAHLTYLAKTRNIVPFSRLSEHLDDPTAMAITFDDGYRSVRSVALPVLERLGIPFKTYLLAAAEPTVPLWLNQLSYVLHTRPIREISELARIALGIEVPESELGDATPFVEHFVESTTPAAIRECFEKCRPEPMADLYLSEDDIRALAAHPLVELGSHSRNHYPLHRVSAETLETEVVSAHHELAGRYGCAIDGFCPPFGYRHHLTEAVVRKVANIDSAVLSAYGGRTGPHEIHGLPEIRRIGAWGNLGVLWHQLKYEPDPATA